MKMVKEELEHLTGMQVDDEAVILAGSVIKRIHI